MKKMILAIFVLTSLSTFASDLTQDACISAKKEAHKLLKLAKMKDLPVKKISKTFYSSCMDAVEQGMSVDNFNIAMFERRNDGSVMLGLDDQNEGLPVVWLMGLNSITNDVVKNISKDLDPDPSKIFSFTTFDSNFVTCVIYDKPMKLVGEHNHCVTKH